MQGDGQWKEGIEKERKQVPRREEVGTSHNCAGFLPLRRTIYVEVAIGALL